MDLICSVLAVYTGDPVFTGAAFMAVVGGVLFGFAAMATGAYDLIAVAEEKRVLKKALIHGGINATVVIAYSIPAYRAYQAYPSLEPDTIALLVVKAALVTFMIVGNYLGGSLVLRHGVGTEKAET